MRHNFQCQTPVPFGYQESYNTNKFWRGSGRTRIKKKISLQNLFDMTGSSAYTTFEISIKFAAFKQFTVLTVFQI